MKVAPFPAPNVRWRERLLRAATTQAMRLEFELAQLAARADAAGWPVVDGSVPGPFPEGSFVALRVGWISWFEEGIEHVGPDWNLARDGRLLSGEGVAVPTEDVAAALVRLDACDRLATTEERRRAYDEQLELVRRNVTNCLGHLEARLRQGPPPAPSVPAEVAEVAVAEPVTEPRVDDVPRVGRLARLRRGH